MNHFKPGDKVRAKPRAVNGTMEHYGVVVKQVGECVLWECDECDGMMTSDLEDDLELLP